ncbi:MAG: HEAT repeat domain-containing protein [Planctomycetota bacterium]|jgi:HEAT repeat protein
MTTLPARPAAWFAGIALASAALAGGASAGETSEAVERAIEAARGGNVVRAAVLSMAAFSSDARSGDAVDAEREVREALERGAAELERALAADDAGVRASAAWALGWTACRSAGVKLADMLADPDREVRVEAARALGRLGSRRHESALLRFAADEDAWVRAAALESLGLLGSSWSAGVRGLTDTSSQVRLAAAGLLARVAPGTSPPAGSEGVLVRALVDDSPVVRTCVAATLGRVGGEGSVEPLKAAAMEKDAMVSGAAVEALGDIGEPAAEALVEIAGTAVSAGGGEISVAVRAARALGRTDARATRVVEAIGRLVEEAPTDVAKAAAESLGSIGGEGAKRVLAEAGAGREVRVDVAVAAARLGEFAPARLLLADLCDADPWVRFAAARGLADTGNPVGFPVFFDALESDDGALRTYAGACLAVYARANIDYREAWPEERPRLAKAWRQWWLGNRETFVVPGVRAEAAADRPAGARR